jgi:hypothetical protein
MLRRANTAAVARASFFMKELPLVMTAQPYRAATASSSAEKTQSRSDCIAVRVPDTKAVNLSLRNHSAARDRVRFWAIPGKIAQSSPIPAIGGIAHIAHRGVANMPHQKKSEISAEYLPLVGNQLLLPFGH